MSCEICGKGACCKSFHSLDEQQDFDSIADDIKERARSQITNKLQRLDCIDHEDKYYILLDDAIGVVDDVLY